MYDYNKSGPIVPEISRSVARHFYERASHVAACDGYVVWFGEIVKLRA